MKLLSSNWRDIQRYYEGSFVKLPEFGDRLFVINGVSESRVLFHDANGEEGVIYLDNEHPYDLNYIMPHKSNYQLGNSCFNMLRVPARQYYRGITGENTNIYKLTETGFKGTSLTWANINGYIEKAPFVTIKEVLSGKYISAALSTRFAMTVRGKLYLDHKVIGNVKGNTLSIHPLFIPEITKILHLTGCISDFNLKEVRVAE